MAPNTKRHIDAKVKICEFPVILEKPYKWFVPIMDDSPLLFVTKMDTQIGVLIACHIQLQEYYNESKQYLHVLCILL